MNLFVIPLLYQLVCGKVDGLEVVLVHRRAVEQVYRPVTCLVCRVVISLVPGLIFWPKSRLVFLPAAVDIYLKNSK